MAMEDDVCRIRDADGTLYLELRAGQAAGMFQLPSFAGNIKYFGVHDRMAGTSVEFRVKRRDLAQIRDFMERPLWEARPDELKALRRKGLGKLVAGVASILASFLLCWIFAEPIGGYEITPSGPFFLAFFGGIGLLSFGANDLGKVRRVRKNAARAGGGMAG